MTQHKDLPIDRIYAAIMQQTADRLENALNGNLRGKDRQTGFCLMIFPFYNKEGKCNYISNARRQDIVRLLKDQVVKLEAATPSAASN